MQYMGGKSKIGKEIADVIINNSSSKRRYIEPFCGSLGVMRHIPNSYERYACDGCLDLILLFKELQNNKFDKPVIDEEKWLQLKNNKEHSALRGFVGFSCSFGGKWFSSYSGKYGSRDYVSTGYNGLKKINLENIKFEHSDYKDLNLESGEYIIYCDPPYNYSKFKFKGSTYDFNIEEFWRTVKKWSECGNIVFVSETNAPDFAKCIWSKKLNKTINNHVGNNGFYVDKLFIIVR